jgi:integrase
VGYQGYMISDTPLPRTACTSWMREGKDLMAALPYLSAYMGHAHMSDTYYYIHLVPGQLEAMSGYDFSKYEALLPEVECNE